MRLTSIWSYTEGAAAPVVVEEKYSHSSTMRRRKFKRTGLGIRHVYYILPLLMVLPNAFI